MTTAPDDYIDTNNIPLSTSPIQEFLGHESDGGILSLRRFSADSVLGAITDGIENIEPRVATIETLNAGPRLTNLELGQATGGAVYATKAALDADLAHAVNTKGEVYADATAANNGVYRKNGASGTGSWTKISDLAITVVAADVARLSSHVKAHSKRMDALGEASVECVAARAIFTGVPVDTAGFSGWSIVHAAAEDGVIDGFATYLGYAGAFGSFTILAVERPTSDTSTTAPGSGTTDVILSDLDPHVVYNPLGETLNPGAAAVLGIKKPIVSFGRPVLARAGYTYIFMIRALDGSAMPIDVGRLQSDVTGFSTLQQSWYYASDGTIGNVNGVIVSAGYIFRRIPAGRALSGSVRYSGAPVFNGLKVALHNILQHGLNGTRPLFGSVMTCGAAATGSTTQTLTLQYFGTFYVLNHANITITQVRRHSNSAVLAQGTDYDWAPNGKIYGTQNVADYDVDVDYTYKLERLDLLYEQPTSSFAAVLAGTARAHTAHEDLYRPKAQVASQRPIGNVRVVGAAIADITLVCDWIGTRSIEHDPEIDWYVRRNREVMAAFFAKLQKGTGVILAGIGDSRTFCGALPDPPDMLAPNRSGADTDPWMGTMYTATTETDFNTNFTAFCVANGLTVTVNGQTRYRLGPNWRMIDMLIKGWGYAFVADANPTARQCTYLNFGVNASTVDTTGNNMGNATRLATVINPSAYGPGWNKPDLVLFNPGMNGTPDATFEDKCSTIVTTLQNAGIAVLMYGPGLTNIEVGFTATNRFPNIDEWRNVHACLRRVAIFTGCGYMPMDMCQGDGFEGYMGLPRAMRTRPNYQNHDGPYERRKAGEFLARTLTP